MVYILNKDGQPMMPTERHGKVRRLLKNKLAKVVSYCPFVVQLLYKTETENTQEITLGVDAGSKHIGLSATTATKELYVEEVEIRNDIVELLSGRRAMRSARRNRTTRYRAPRFNNRKKEQGWLAPSIRNKIGSHLAVIAKIHKFLPVSKIVAEVASFDIQKIKNPDISGAEYQQGEQLGFWNVREYVLCRDGHTCQCCKGKSKDPILNVHHIESRKTGGNAPNNLVTLCETCHKKYHQGKIKLPEKIRRGISFDDAAFMGIMRWAFYDELKALYPNVSLTFGYITKNTRIANGLQKTHCVDARCISKNPTAKPLDFYYYTQKKRCHNRQLHQNTIYKGGYRKNNQAPKKVFGYQLFDKVLCKGEVGFVFARRSSGSFDIRRLDHTKISGGISYKKLKKLQSRSSYLTELRHNTNIVAA